MSTKVYEAWRTPVTNLPAFLSAFRNEVFNAVAKHFRRTRVKAGSVSKFEIKAAVEKWYAAGKKPERDMGDDVAASLNVFVVGRFAYAIPYGEEWTRALFRPTYPTVDYCYWNNSDRPDDVSAAEWRTRGLLWDALCDDWDRVRLVYTAIDPVTGHGLDQVVARVVSAKADKENAWSLVNWAIREAAKGKK